MAGGDIRNRTRQERRGEDAQRAVSMAGFREEKFRDKLRVDGSREEKEQYLRQLVQAGLNPARNLSDDEILAEIDRTMLTEGRRLGLTVEERRMLRKRLFDSLRRYDVLQDLLEDETITEIMVNGCSHIFVERRGRIEEWPEHFSSRERLEDVIQQIVSRVNRTVNTASPIVDARLPEGSRVNAVLPPAAPDGPILTIRKFPSRPITMEQLISWDSITPEAAHFLEILVSAGYNLFISGGTGSGKTTFLNALSAYIPSEERVITIEDSLELQLEDIPNLVRLETRDAGSEGAQAITIRDLIRTALRMRPDRIIVGEVRGAEALDMLSAFNTGHDGSLSTAHANSPGDLMSRLETMVLMAGELPLAAIRQQIASSVEILVHLGRVHGGGRKVLRIEEVLGYEAGEIRRQPLFIRSAETGRLMPAGNPLAKQRKLLLRGAELQRTVSELLCAKQEVRTEQEPDEDRTGDGLSESAADSQTDLTVCGRGNGTGSGGGRAVLSQRTGDGSPASSGLVYPAQKTTDRG